MYKRTLTVPIFLGLVLVPSLALAARHEAAFTKELALKKQVCRCDCFDSSHPTAGTLWTDDDSGVSEADCAAATGEDCEGDNGEEGFLSCRFVWVQD